MAVQTTLLNDEGNDLSPEMKTYYQKRLIELAQPNLVFMQFSQKAPIPANHGKTTEWRSYDPLVDKDDTITEGVTPEGDKLNVKTITATISQYGNWVQVSDILQKTAIDNNLAHATKLLGQQAGRSLDRHTRDVVVAGSNVIFPDKIVSGDPVEVSLREDLDETAKLNVEVIERAVAVLEAQNAPTINGDYVGIVHPYAKYDLRRDEEWEDAHKYAKPEELYNGELGRIAGVRFVKTTQAKIFKDVYCPIVVDTYSSSKTYEKGDLVEKDDVVYAAKQDIDTAEAWTAAHWEEKEDGTGRMPIFATMILGDGAYGTTEIEGGGLENIIKPLGYGDDPMNQRASSAWKATHAAVRLIEQYMVRIESWSKYSDKVAEN